VPDEKASHELAWERPRIAVSHFEPAPVYLVAAPERRG
jgi:hypothetical protein